MLYSVTLFIIKLLVIIKRFLLFWRGVHFYEERPNEIITNDYHKSFMPRENKIKPGCRVTGRFGELIDPPGGIGININGKKKRRVRREVHGTVVIATAHRKWNVRFDHDGQLREVSANSLRVVDDISGVDIDHNKDKTVSIIKYETIYFMCLTSFY